jgi:ElaB/YqjD/DUF883 family membrane-anchored ribosome-binding protein
MAEKSSELRNADELDPISTTSGTRNDEFLTRYADEDLDVAGREFDTTAGDAPEETEQIKAQIQETRSQMGETIDAIQERLSFANISEQVSETVNTAIESAKETAYDATIGKAVNFMKNFGDGVTHSSTVRTIKGNPLPFALIGLGAGMLFYQSYNKSSNRGDGRYGRRFSSQDVGQPDRDRLASAARTDRNTEGGGTFDGITKTASSAIGTVGDAAGSAFESVTGAVSNVYSGAGEVAQRAYSRVGDFGSVASEKYDEYLEENPLALGALAVAVGAAVGFAIPSTRYEGQLMGEARENLVQRAQEAAGSLVDKAKQVAAEAGETIKQETQALTQ